MQTTKVASETLHLALEEKTRLEALHGDLKDALAKTGIRSRAFN